MNNQLAHRGPDNEGIFIDEKIALGHRRLSIIDLSSEANQPFNSSDGRFVIVYNGELYNYRELKKQLSDYQFRTNSDTEVVLNAYIKWGPDSLNRFNGMYAFAIWDKVEETLFLARDRMGVKPLYYSKFINGIIFSSEIRALLASGTLNKKIDCAALYQFLQFQTVYAPNTLIEGIKMLPPGHYLQVTKTSQNFFKYWSLDSSSNKNANIKYPEACQQVSELFKRSVSRRLVADVPFGAFLSGGIDSTAVVAAMSLSTSQPIKTFSIVFNEKEFTEEKYSNLVSKKFGTRHHPIRLSVNDFKNLVPHALKALDHPSGDGPNTYVVSKFTKEAGVTMALSGIGSDELFAGYDVFRRLPQMFKWRVISAFPNFLKKTTAHLLKKIKPGVKSAKLNRLLNYTEWDFNNLYQINRKLFDTEESNSLLLNSAKDDYSVNLNNVFNPSKLVTSISLAEIKTYLQNVLLRDTDQMSMANALEVREPFLDHELVEFVLSLPDSYKLNKQPKKLLIDSLGDLIPQEVYNRPKMGFTFPWKRWLQNDLKIFCEDRLYSLAKRPYFNKNALIELWEGFLRNDPEINWSKIWILVVLEDWLTTNSINQ